MAPVFPVPMKVLAKKPAAMKVLAMRPAAMKILAKKPAANRAPAWVSGGSSGKPRVGKPYQGPASKHPRNPPTMKSGAARLTTRRSYKKPSGKVKVPYVPLHRQKERGAHFQVRDSAGKGDIKLESLLKMSQRQLLTSLWKTGQLSKLTKCTHCRKGKLGIMKLRNKQYAKRCRAKKCQKWNAIQAGNPVFWTSRGSSHVDLKTQAAILHCAVWGVPQSLVPALIEGIQRWPVDRMYIAWRKLVQQYVKGKQDSIKFGQPKDSVDRTAPLDECEWDEAVVRKEDKPDHQVEWYEYVAGKRRGDRESLFVQKRGSAHSMSTRTESGKACPPPMTKAEWTKIRDQRVGAGTLSHTDGAPAYHAQRDDTRHDAVTHSRQKGKKPQWTKATKHQDLGGRTVQSVGGTQSLDGWWAHGKRATFGVQARNHDGVDAHFRSEQWRHWVGAKDRWAAAGEVFQWIPA